MDHVSYSVVSRSIRVGVNGRGIAQCGDRAPVCVSVKKALRRTQNQVRCSAADEGASEIGDPAGGKMGSITTGGRAPQPLPVKGMKVERYLKSFFLFIIFGILG
jgi:hypothetical protein